MDSMDFKTTENENDDGKPDLGLKTTPNEDDDDDDHDYKVSDNKDCVVVQLPVVLISSLSTRHCLYTTTNTHLRTYTNKHTYTHTYIYVYIYKYERRQYKTSTKIDA